jgi:hypothetical protein
MLLEKINGRKMEIVRERVIAKTRGEKISVLIRALKLRDSGTGHMTSGGQDD